MVGKRLDMSARGRARVVISTVVGTAGCIAIALFIDSFDLSHYSEADRLSSIRNDFLIPAVLAGPIIWFLTSKLRELAIAHYELTIVASTDSLTDCLNRGAFTTLVDAYLSRVKVEENAARGALLVIDADNFKSINDKFGHDRGDEALKIIAAAIKGTLHGADIVGRLGGEEFGVFLPGTSPAQARAAAEEIRQTIERAEFRPNGEIRPLSVSVGGALFDQEVSLTELLREADLLMYRAKHDGRNRVALGKMALAA